MVSLTIMGAGFFPEWPFTGCPKPETENSYFVVRANLDSEHSLSYDNIQVRAGSLPSVPVAASLSWESFEKNSWFSGAGREQVGNGVHWLVFNFPKGYEPYRQETDPARLLNIWQSEPLPPLDDAVKGTREGAKTLGLSPEVTEAWVQNGEWLVNTYGAGTTFFGGTLHGMDWSLVVSDPYTGLWGTMRLPIIDPFAGVDAKAPYLSPQAVGTPSLGK